MKKMLALMMTTVILIQLFVPTIQLGAVDDVNDYANNSVGADPVAKIDQIMSAQIIRYNRRPTLIALDGYTGTNNNTVNILVWSAHSLKDNCDYYFFEMYGAITAVNTYKGERYCNKYGYIETGYIKDVRLEVEVVNSKEGSVRLVNGTASPSTKEKTTWYLSGINHTLGGSIALDKGNPIQFNGGVTFNKQYNIPSDDIEVQKSECVGDSTNNIQWDFTGKTTSSGSSPIYPELNLKSCPSVAQSCVSPQCYWVWKFNPEMREQKHEVKLTLGTWYVDSIDGKKHDIKYDGGTITFELEKPPLSGKETTVDEIMQKNHQ